MELTEKTLSSKSVFDGRILHITLDEIELPDGKKSKREVVNHPGGVTVAALDEDNNLLFVRQFRYPHGKVLLELPAGKLEWGENHFECGKRELLEETGCTAEVFTYLGCLLPTPAYDTEVIHMYMAKKLCRDKQKLDEDEFLEVMTIPLDKAVEMVINNEIEDAKTQLAILKTAALLGR